MYVACKRQSKIQWHKYVKKKSNEKAVLCKESLKKARVAIPIPDKIDFKKKFIVKDKEGYFISIKWSSHQKYNILKHTCI